MRFLLRAPAHPARGCAGVLVFLLAVLSASCGDAKGRDDSTLDIGSDTIQLAPGVRIHDVAIRSATEGEFSPPAVEVRRGDVIRFQTADERTHVIAFTEAELPAQARELFTSKNQLKSPPLLVKGAQWIVSLEGAPAGEYKYHCVTHGVAGTFAAR